jgi:hypothetical protein
MDRVELNQPVDDTIFASPEDIQPADGVLAGAPL